MRRNTRRYGSHDVVEEALDPVSHNEYGRLIQDRMMYARIRRM
jgi:hypothetical protein